MLNRNSRKPRGVGDFVAPAVQLNGTRCVQQSSLAHAARSTYGEDLGQRPNVVQSAPENRADARRPTKNWFFERVDSLPQSGHSLACPRRLKSLALPARSLTRIAGRKPSPGHIPILLSGQRQARAELRLSVVMRSWLWHTFCAHETRVCRVQTRLG